jgi:hypothetical protein
VGVDGSATLRLMRVSAALRAMTVATSIAAAELRLSTYLQLLHVDVNVASFSAVLQRQLTL